MIIIHIRIILSACAWARVRAWEKINRRAWGCRAWTKKSPPQLEGLRYSSDRLLPPGVLSSADSTARTIKPLTLSPVA